MQKIALVACSKRKLGENEPERTFKVQDIYTGNTFRKSKAAYAEQFGCDDFYILSSKHYLLDKNDEISYYDIYLGCQSEEYKSEWADKVISSLKEKYDLENTLFYIFGEKSYYENLISHLKCVVFGFDSNDAIDFDAQSEYKNGGNIDKER